MFHIKVWLEMEMNLRINRMCTKNSENQNPQKPGEGQSGDSIVVVVMLVVEKA